MLITLMALAIVALAVRLAFVVRDDGYGRLVPPNNRPEDFAPPRRRGRGA